MFPVLVNDGKGVNFELNLYNNTASVVQSPYASGSILIQRYIIYSSKLYTIIAIKKKSFRSNNHIRSISFSNDSELQVIEECAFEYSSLESIQIPSSVISIGKQAFFSCQNLTSVDIPPDSKLDAISEGLFSSTSIKNLNIPSSVTRIDDYAFSCSNIETINIPNDSQLVSIGEDAFGCSKIKSLFIPPLLRNLKEGWCHETMCLNQISVSPKNKFFTVVDGKIIIFKSNPNTSDYDTICFAVRNIESIVIPSFIKSIQSFSFSYCKKLQAVIFTPDSNLQTIKKGAFMSSSVTSIELPKKVSSIESYAFESCFGLKKFEFPKNKKLKIIDECLLRGASIEKISIPSSVTQINFRAFSDCNDLKLIDFPPDSKVKCLQNYVFYYNNELESISFPSTIKEVGSCVFCGCTKLKKIDFPKNIPLEMISSLMFFSTGLKSAIIPANVSKVYNECFAECESLVSVEFLGNSILISDLIFDNSVNMMVVSFPNAKKIEIDESAFDGVNDDFKIFVLPGIRIKII